MPIAIPQDFLEDDVPSFTPMTSGRYDLVLLQHSWEEYNKIPGKEYLLMEFQIDKGDFQGRKVFCRFNLYHPSDAAKGFSWAMLKQMAEAIGQDPVAKQEIDIEAMDGCKVTAEIKVSQHEQYGMQIDIKKFFKKSARVVKPGPDMQMVKDDDDFQDDSKKVFGQANEDLPW